MYVSSRPALSPMLPLRKPSTCHLPYPFSAEHKTYAHLAPGLVHHLVRALALPAGAEVLVPDLHAPELLAAIRAAGARVRFFRVTHQLLVDLDDLARRAVGSVRAVMVSHLLGWPEGQLAAIAELCRARDLPLLEDCTHALFAELGGAPVGTFGDYAVFSFPEALPVPNGGVLVQNRRVLPGLLELEAALEPCRPGQVAERTATLVSAAVQLDAPWAGAGLRAAERLAAIARELVRRRAPDEVDEGRFDLQLGRLAMAPLTRHVLERIDFDGIAERRRLLHAMLSQRLVDRVRTLDRPFTPGASPLSFPLFVADPALAVRELRRRGVDARAPWTRGDPALDPARATAARWLREHTVEVPLHQELGPEHVEHLVRAILDAGRATEPAPPFGRTARPRPPERAGIAVVPPLTVLRGRGAANDDALTVETLAGGRALEVLAAEWSALAGECTSSEPSTRPEWLAAHLAPLPAGARLLVLAVRCAGRLRAVLPLVEERTTFLGLPVRRLVAPVDPAAGRFELAVARADADRALVALWRHLAEMTWDVLVLQPALLVDSAVARLAAVAEAEHWPVLRGLDAPVATGADGAKSAGVGVLSVYRRSGLGALLHAAEVRNAPSHEARGPAGLDATRPAEAPEHAAI